MSLNIKNYVDGPHIHGSLYRDQAIFDLEVERIWKKVWVYVGHESQVPNEGDFVRTQIGKQPMILSRGRDNQVRVFFNRCRHRANLVCFEQRGNSDGFVCPYPGWSYSNSGELLQPTFEEGYDHNLDKDDFALSQAPRVGSYRGLVFASLAPAGITLEEHLGQSREFIDLIAYLTSLTR